MKKYLVEFVLGFVLVVIFFAVSTWQSSDTLSEMEVDQYIEIMEKKSPFRYERAG